MEVVWFGFFFFWLGGFFSKPFCAKAYISVTTTVGLLCKYEPMLLFEQNSHLGRQKECK